MTAFAMSQQERKEIKISKWFSEYGNRLLRFVQSKISDWEEAEDISQEVWYQLSRQDEIDDIEKIGAWLFTAANNRVINFYKKKKTIPFSDLNTDSTETEKSEDDITDGVSFHQWAEESLPSEILESKEFWDVLQQFLLKLPDEQREVFIENELNDVSFREMSEKTGVSINTLLARKSYAVKRLRAEFNNLFNH
jgi:RNA polymerase sigma factor (sigma-70 family)